MRLLVCILSKTDKLDSLLKEFVRVGIRGATILPSNGMARMLVTGDDTDNALLSSIRALLNPNRDKSYTIMAVIRSGQLPIAVQAIEGVVGNLDEEDTGIVFSMPIDFVKGIAIVD